MSGYLYFPNNIKDIEDHIWAYMISYKIFFQLMITAFKENLNLQLPLIVLGLYLKQYSFQISDKFMTKFNVFSYMVL